MIAFLQDTWPLFAAIALVCGLTAAALMPYIRADRKRRAQQETPDD